MCDKIHESAIKTARIRQFCNIDIINIVTYHISEKLVNKWINNIMGEIKDEDV